MTVLLDKNIFAGKVLQTAHVHILSLATLVAKASIIALFLDILLYGKTAQRYVKKPTKGGPYIYTG